MRRALILLPLLFIAAASLDQQVREALGRPQPDVERLRALGPRVLPSMAKVYESSTEAQRTQIAWAFYSLGWKSPDAKRVLMRDVHTPNESLRLQVQWALGRVSNDADVVEVLSDIMQHDTSPVFRDKAACALANDQIHLTDVQKAAMLRKVIAALRDPNTQVRTIAMQVLQIQTGQTKGFRPFAPAPEREKVVKEWERWIDEYARNL